MEEHVVEGVTYEIVDVVDASYARLGNPDDDQNAADVEYLELDMEVVDADAAEYFSNADESQEESGQLHHTIIQQQSSQKVPQIFQVNGNQCLAIKDDSKFVNGSNERKRKFSEPNLPDNIRFTNRDTEETKTREKSSKSECDSLDLFFQSMAQTVLHLPPQVQAKIKMDICKVISMAEIKYCSTMNSDSRKDN